MPAPHLCPVCGTAAPQRIIYGLPTPDLLDDPIVVIGGCMVSQDSPAWRCASPACRHEFTVAPRRRAVSGPRTVTG